MIALATALVFGGCKSRPTPGPHDADLLESGKALVIYDYSRVQTPDWTVAVHAEIPVVIEKDPAAQNASYRVIGNQAATFHVTVEGPAGPTRDCLINCAFPSMYIVRGKMNLEMEQGKPNCVFSLKIYGDFVGNEIEPSGTCPIGALDNYNCTKFCLAVYDERTVSLDKNNQVITPEPEYDGAVEYRVEIKGVELPGDVGCTWDE